MDHVATKIHIRGPKIIIKSVTIGDGEGESGKWESEPPQMNDKQMWEYIASIVNAECNTSVDYRYLGHFIKKTITTPAKTSGSMGGNTYLFDWELHVVMERELA